MAPFFSLALLVAGLLTGARAQDELLVLNPPLSQAFPLDARPDGVRVLYPVLVNDHTVIQPGELLRFIYVDPTAGLGNHRGSGSSGGFRSPGGLHGTLPQEDSAGGGPTGGWGRNDGDPDAGIFDENKDTDAKRGKSELQTEVWKQRDLFTEALDHASELGTTLVYSLPAQNHPLTATIDLPDGMLLAEVEGHVRVLGLSQESRAFQGGVRPGDEIRAFGPDTPVATLQDFMRGYAAIKRQTKLTGDSSYAMEIWRPDEGQTVSIQIAAPPTIPHFF